ITPGKKADLVIIETKSPNIAPVIDPVGAIVCAADISNVDTVLIDGKVMKRNGKLVQELSGPRRLVEASRDYLVGTFGTPEPGWLPAKVTA
ncbi:MAG TPA: amidohydrolase, partial [Candidatus Eisenbacteria bacterium]|nr:amidohydrolase [Candidatus Eisenbacteria bacterium]